MQESPAEVEQRDQRHRTAGRPAGVRDVLFPANVIEGARHVAQGEITQAETAFGPDQVSAVFGINPAVRRERALAELRSFLIVSGAIARLHPQLERPPLGAQRPVRLRVNRGRLSPQTIRRFVITHFLPARRQAIEAGRQIHVMRRQDLPANGQRLLEQRARAGTKSPVSE